jgi:DedD protein
VQTRYQTDQDLQDLHGASGQDREISLGTTTILGIFFTLALICAVFFGFGYSMGRRSVQPTMNAAEPTVRTDANSALKPAPGSLAGSADKQPAVTQSAIVPAEAPDTTAVDTQPVPVNTPETSKTVAASPQPNANPQAPPDAPVRPAVIPVSTSASSAGSLVVQVAAMSHQEDADVVATDLKRRGYTVAIRHEPQDKLFHVQIGSFSTKKDADSMRLRLQTDGYNNAIVK